MLLSKNTGLLSVYPTLYFLQIATPAILTFYSNDAYLSYVVLNINGDSASSGNNNIFLDNSNSGITNTSTTTQGVFSPFSPAGWSGYFNGVSDALTVPSNNVVGDFSIEFWVYKQSSTQTTILHFNNGASLGMHIWINASNQLVVDDGVNQTSAFTTVTVPLYRWCHIAVIRNGTTVTGYINGVITGSGTTFVPSTNNSLSIGRFNNSFYFYGYISNIRIVKNTVLYTTNFTPNSAEPLKLLQNTSLLTLQNNRFVDNSRNNYSISVAGTPQIQPFSPISPSIEYIPSLHGGSAYFDGNTYLSIPDNPGWDIGGRGTIEFWFYLTGDSATNQSQVKDAVLFAQANNYTFNIRGDATKTGTKLELVVPSLITLTYTADIIKYVWHHVALVTNGSNITMYYNGVNVASAAYTSTTNFTNPLILGGLINVASYPNRYIGYISNFRIVRGQTVYTSNFTPPTRLLTDTSNGGASVSTTAVPDLSVKPALLLNFDNGGIIDRSYKNNITVVGDVKTQPLSSKFGAGSLVFDGNGDYLTALQSDNLNLASGDFTVEAWVYSTTIATGLSYAISRSALTITTGNDAQYLIFRDAATLKVKPYQGTTDTTINLGTITANTWYHIALVRSGNTFYGYLNGVRNATALTITGALNNNSAWNGVIIGGASTNSWNGLIEDVRITKGIARYTAATEIIPTKSQANNTDPFYSNVVLFLNGNSIGSASNNVFRGNAGNGASLTITRTNATQGSFSPFSPNGWSGYFNGSSFFKTTGTTIGNGDFTIECWVYLNALGDRHFINIDNGSFSNAVLSLDSGANKFRFLIRNDSTNTGSQLDIQSNLVAELNTWYHVCGVANGNIGTLYVNGSSALGNTGTIAAGRSITGNIFRIGVLSTETDRFLNGYLSNVRIVRGLSVYTSNFTPPTGPLPALSGSGFNTSLLTLQSNRLRDNSSNNVSLSAVTGTVSIQAFNPFKQTTEYSPTLHGASGYFDGTSYLLVTSNLTNFYISTGITTVECYVYKIGTEKDIIISQTQNGGSPYAGWIFYIDNQTLKVETGSNVTVSSNILVPLNQWVHVAFVRENTTVTLYINGINAGSGTLSITNFNGNLAIGSYTTSVATNNFNGYISNLRMVRGVSVYKSNFTPPTEPVTSINGTVLLLNFDNGSVIDSTGNNVMTTVGSSNTEVLSTAPLSSSTGSLYFDGGASTYITGIYNNRYEFPSGTPFTIECWFNIKANSALISTTRNAAIINTSSSTGFDGYGLYILGDATNTGTGIRFQQYGASGSAEFITATINLNKNTWYHLALVRNNLNQYSIYLNGKRLTTTGSITTFTRIYGTTLRIGAANEAAYISLFNGYIDDLRITKGIARYTNDFTPQTYKNPTSNILTYPTDPFKNYVVLDLNADTVNNEQNNTFLDRSGNNLAISRSGSTTQGSFSPFSPAGWSGYFNGSTDYLTVSDSNASIASGDFTIECWIYTLDTQFQIIAGTASGGLGFGYNIDNSTQGLWLGRVGVGPDVTSGVQLTYNTWNHIAVTRSSGNVRFFVNGVQTGSTTASNTTYISNSFYIGRDISNTTSFYYSGYISNLRIVKGQALYTNTFTPPTAALTTTNTVSGVLSAENVSLLTLQDNRFKDNSNNNFTITPNGTPSVKPFSPFQPTATYSPTVHGGSGYFNSNSDVLSIPTNSLFAIGTDRFTLEFWINFTTWSSTGIQRFFVIGIAGTDGLVIAQSNNNIIINITNSTKITYAFTPTLNVWYHFSLIRRGTGTNELRFYINGKNVANATSTENIAQNAAYIGGITWGTGYQTLGYISNLHLVKGVAITPPVNGPTSLVQAVSGTSLLLNFDNAGVVDSTAKNNVITFNTAKVDYANKVYGSGALKFNGTNDYMQVGTASDWTFLHISNTKWTIEFWLYSNSSTNQTILDTNGSTLAANGISLQKKSDNTIDIFITNNTAPNFVARATTTAVIPLTTWTHVAITYDHSLTSNNLVIYLNGLSSMSATKTAQTPSTTTPANTLTIGAYGNGANQFFNGSIDELRVTNAVRYTSNFSVSSYTQPLLS